MSQTSYTEVPDPAFSGMLYDISEHTVDSKVNDEGAALPFGVGVTQGSSGELVESPDASGDKIVGIVLHEHGLNPIGMPASPTDAGVQDGERFSMMTKGRCYVKVEEDVEVNDPVFCRHTVNGGNTQLGRFRASVDVVSAAIEEVHTVTPTAANAKVYVLRVSIGEQDFTFEYLSDADATATEICDGFRTLMAADAQFTALVVASGTTTLVLTGQTGTGSFVVQSEGDGVLADVETTPSSGGVATASRVKGARFITAAASGKCAVIEFDALMNFLP
jgi:hypothetical protein